MRSRKRKNGEARMEACGEIILPFDKENITPVSLTELFPGKKSFRIEIGCGKGAFISGIAERNPDVGFIAVEKIADVLIVAAEKIKNSEMDNVRFLCCDAVNLEAIFPANCFERIYLNFSDPWPKARHAKRRLTYHEMLNRFQNLLSEKGKIEFKTDNRDLFDFSLEEFKEAGYILENVTFDLHASEWAKDNIVTEYEANFSAKGFKINRLEAYLPEKA
ncbi:MAG: tRNA (guanosine(46)-N7)-methyltransferase TrmB [Clostridia bacterium]|nr:tRNA (guanosine(46)-N7)-methyltransferase TrmB [Clostridia bacterium]